MEKTACPVIPNRAIKSDTVDVKLFNMYNGPFCNFNSHINGVYIPYSIDVLCKQNTEQSNNSHIIIDLLGNKNTYFYMKKLNSMDTRLCFTFKKSTTSSNNSHNEKNKKAV